MTIEEFYRHIHDYQGFVSKNTAAWAVHEQTYYKYVQEARANINRATGHAVQMFDTKKEHDEVLKKQFDKVCAYLLSSASVKTSDSWRKLRRAFSMYYRSAGFKALSNQISEIQNPNPAHKRNKKPKKKKRLITVTDEIYSEILSNRKQANDDVSVTMIKLGKEFGIRPCEATGIEILDFNVEKKTMSVFIEGAKKTLRGEKNKAYQRGIDRILHVPISKDLIETIKRAQELDDAQIKACQERIRNAGRKLWPNRMRRFCLYSLRYTFGSNLKKANLNRRDGNLIVAAAMGHKCTSSCSEYGSIQSGVSTVLPSPDIETIKQVVDDRAQKYGLQRGEKINVRKALEQEAVDKRDSKRQPSRKDIAARESQHYKHSDAKEITQRIDPFQQFLSKRNP